jgi:hypothetical protein
MSLPTNGFPPLSALALVLCGALTSAAASQEPDRGRLEPLHRIRPELLARAYLVNEYTLGLIDMARQGATVELQAADSSLTVTAANAGSMDEEYERRRAAYAAAIEARGFTRIAGEFELATAGCGAPFGPMLLEVRQAGFVVTLGEGVTGIVVEQTLVLGQGSESEGTYSHGEVRDDGIELRRFDQPDCQLTLSRYRRPDVQLADPAAMLGTWEGQWDGQWDVRFTITPADGGYSVRYEWREVPGAEYSSMTHAAHAASPTSIRFEAIVLTLEPRAEDGATAVGSFAGKRTARLRRRP